MDAASFERIYDSFQKFHTFFAASFGRKQWWENSRNYLQALLVQAQERRNAENLSESVGVSARAMQRCSASTTFAGSVNYSCRFTPCFWLRCWATPVR